MQVEKSTCYCAHAALIGVSMVYSSSPLAANAAATSRSSNKNLQKGKSHLTQSFAGLCARDHTVAAPLVLGHAAVPQSRSRYGFRIDLE